MSRMIYTRVYKKCACILFVFYFVINYPEYRFCCLDMSGSHKMLKTNSTKYFCLHLIFRANFISLFGESIKSFQSHNLLNIPSYQDGKLFVNQSNSTVLSVTCIYQVVELCDSFLFTSQGSQVHLFP